MVSCEDIHERIARGETPTSPEEQAHLDECAACRLLLDDDSRPPVEVPDLAGLRDAVRVDIARERGPLAYFRSLSTPVRLVAAGLLAAVVALPVLLVIPRVDFDLYPTSRMAVAVVVLVASLLVAVAVVLRPLQRRPLHPAVVWGALVAAVVLPWVLALMPRAHALHPASLRGDGSELVPLALRCLAFGIATGLPLLIALWALDRGAHAALRRALVAAAAAGVAGNLAPQFHCPITSPAHLVLGHATVGLVLLAGYLLAAVRARRAM
jgi:hypothetical protein